MHGTSPPPEQSRSRYPKFNVVGTLPTKNHVNSRTFDARFNGARKMLGKQPANPPASQSLPTSAQSCYFPEGILGFFRIISPPGVTATTSFRRPKFYLVGFVGFGRFRSFFGLAVVGFGRFWLVFVGFGVIWSARFCRLWSVLVGFVPFGVGCGWFWPALVGYARSCRSW